MSIIINYQITINLASKRIKRQGTSLPKEAKDPYSENYDSDMIKDDTNRWKDNIMFLDWKNQHCENDYATQVHLQIQCNS